MIFFLHTSRHLWSYGDSMCDNGLLKTQEKQGTDFRAVVAIMVFLTGLGLFRYIDTCIQHDG